MVDSIFMEQLNSYHTTIEIGWRIPIPKFFRDVLINPVSTTFGAILKFCDVSVGHLKLAFIEITFAFGFRASAVSRASLGLIACTSSLKTLPTM